MLLPSSQVLQLAPNGFAIPFKPELKSAWKLGDFVYPAIRSSVCRV